MIIVAICSPKVHPKVPAQEQEMSCAVAVGNMLLAAHALGLGAVWRTGDPARDPVIREGLGLSAEESIVAFLYVGQPLGEPRSEEHTSELQSRPHLVCRLLLEKK